MFSSNLRNLLSSENTGINNLPEAVMEDIKGKKKGSYN